MAIPETLFKYTKLDAGRLILSSGLLRWSSPLKFNDLAEFQRMPRFDPTLDNSLSIFPRVILEIATGKRPVLEKELSRGAKLLLIMTKVLLDAGLEPEEIINRIAEQSHGADHKMSSALETTFRSFGLDSARVCCLTSDPDNDVMWAHYAGNHTGIVFGFRHLPERDTPFLAAQPVKYTTEAPIAGSGLDFLLYGDTQKLRESVLDAVCQTKGINWAYENEWRVVTWRSEEIGKDYGDYRFHPEELESLCFGAKFDPDRESGIRDLALAKYPRCAFYRMVLEQGRLSRVPVA